MMCEEQGKKKNNGGDRDGDGTDADEGTDAIDHGAVVTHRTEARNRTYVLTGRMSGQEAEDGKSKADDKDVDAAETRCHQDV